MAAGWLTGGREYAKGADPFRFPRVIRNRALRRFGWDFDDAASHPRAALRCIGAHQALAAQFLRTANRECILAQIGERLLPSAMPGGKRRKLAKQLFCTVEMDGTYGGWRVEHNIPADVELGDVGGDGPFLPLPDGSSFPVRRYFRQQEERTAWLARRLPAVLELVTYWRDIEGGGGAAPDRTLKSDVLCEWEAISRTAKVRWAEAHGHDWLSLQHDGVVIALHPGMDPEEARADLEGACRRALGYTQPVEVKQMEVDDDASPPPPVLPACDRRPAVPVGRGGGVGGGGLNPGHPPSNSRPPYRGC